MSENLPDKVNRELKALIYGAALTTDLEDYQQAVGFIVSTSWTDDGQHTIGNPVGPFDTYAEAQAYADKADTGLNRGVAADDPERFVVQVLPLQPPTPR